MFVVRADHLVPGVELSVHGIVRSVRVLRSSVLVDVDGHYVCYDLDYAAGVCSLGPLQRAAYQLRREGVLEDERYQYRSHGQVLCRGRRSRLHDAWLARRGF